MAKNKKTEKKVEDKNLSTENEQIEKLEETDENITEILDEEVPQKEEETDTLGIHTDPIPEEVEVAEETVEKAFESMVDIINPKTDEETKLCKLMDSYLEIAYIPGAEVKIKDLENKVKILANILYFPNQSNVKNPTYLYADIEKFFTLHRDVSLSETVAMKYSAALNNRERFQKCMVIYTIMIALVDLKQKKSPFTVSTANASKTLGDKFDLFIAWVDGRVLKLK